jgi:wyosine [tRNA(Phe)-imidazoG37] synthetase (radical SAM superfamily)
MLIFGPVPSRRLGRSLGINNIPPKCCTYSCIYCQVGPTRRTEVVPRAFYAPERIVQEVERHLSQLRERGERVDYLTFVPDGEPTLDVHLGETIERLKTLRIPVAVISNGSLLSRDDVRECLSKADWVSVKLDAVDPGTWRKINRPDPALDHEAMLEGKLRFASRFQGTLATETMLVAGVNDTDANADAVGGFVKQIAAHRAYLSVPIRPPAERGAKPPEARGLNRFFQIVRGYVDNLELLSGYEGDAFASTGRLADDLLAIAAVHPLRESAVQALVERSGGDWSVVEKLVSDGLLILTDFAGRRFYVHRLRVDGKTAEQSRIERISDPTGLAG